MIQPLLPAWIFFPFTGVFAGAYFGLGRADSMVAGAVLSAVAGFRIPGRVSPGKLFPLFMVFVFLLVIGVLPYRATTGILIHTASFLLSFRILILLLASIQTAARQVDRASLTVIIALVTQGFVSLFLIFSGFKSFDPSLVSLALMVNLKVLAVVATFFTPLRWVGLGFGILLAGVHFFPAWQNTSGVLLILLALIEFGFSAMTLRKRIPNEKA
jgi:hypothetical protein